MKAIPVLMGVDAAGRAEAWVANRPGCVVFAEDEASALGQLAEAVEEYDGWTRSIGLAVQDIWAMGPECAGTDDSTERTGVCVVERVLVAEDVVHGNTAAFFSWDEAPATEAEIEATLQLLDASRRDLLAAVHALGRRRWSERPGGGARTVEEILRHVGTAEWWYMSRIVHFPRPKDGEYPDDAELLLAWIRRHVAERLRALSDQERTRIVVPDAASGERWSARKVLRRLVYHELYHVKQLRKLLGT